MFFCKLKIFIENNTIYSVQELHLFFIFISSEAEVIPAILLFSVVLQLIYQ